MRRSVIAATVLLVSVSLVGAQGFDSYDYTSPSTTTTSTYTKPEMKFSMFYTVGAGFSIGGVGSIPGFGSLESATETDGNLSDIDDDYANLGRGLKMDLGASYKFHDYLKVVGGFALTIGIPQAGFVYEDITTTPPSSTTTYTFESNNSQFGLKALLVPTWRIFDLLDMYMGIGLGLYWNSFNYKYSVETTSPGVATVRQEEEGELDLKPTIPFIGMLGVEYPVADRLILYLDGCFEAMNITVREIERGDVNDFNNPDVKFDKDDANEDPPPKMPASNFAIRLGVRVPLF
ncbi:MAG: hypothetical protein GF331_07220 [Chitinivibrionales bacterium]|nr:hypothetical protein [Chitinivibrionales bacterium]